MDEKATPLHFELGRLQSCIEAASCNPFIPAAARDAIGSAGRVIVMLAAELVALRAQVATVAQVAP